jgi:UMF1 family MFS transporter
VSRAAASLPASSGNAVGRQQENGAGQFAWALFDWANSPFTTLIITFVFPAYFAAAIVGDEVRGQAIWGYAIGASGFVVAMLSPLLGAIADVGGRRKPWIMGFTLVCMVATGLLWFAGPSAASVSLALACVLVANIGFEFGTMFNNAMLPDIVSEDRLGRLSGWAWGLGYAGGLAALAVALVAFVQPAVPPFGLDREQAEHVRIVGPLVAIWFGLFVWPLFVFTSDRPGRSLAFTAAIREGLRGLRNTLKELKTNREVPLFLLAHMLYADGLTTLFAFGGVYVSGTFGMSLAEVIVFGLVLNVAAGLGAFLFGWVDDWIGSRPTAALALTGLILASAAAVSVQTRPWLWITGCFIGLFVGPAQAASRSLMARLSPPDRQAAYFGLFALSGRATAFVGPLVVAVVTDATGSQRLGLATIIAFLTAGLVLLQASGRAGRRSKAGAGGHGA